MHPDDNWISPHDGLRHRHHTVRIYIYNYSAVTDEIRYQLVTAGWTKEMVEKQIPYSPDITGKNLYAWTGVEIKIGSVWCQVDTIYDTLYDFINMAVRSWQKHS